MSAHGLPIEQPARHRQVSLSGHAIAIIVASVAAVYAMAEAHPVLGDLAPAANGHVTQAR